MKGDEMRDWMFAQGWLAVVCGIIVVALMPLGIGALVSVAFALYLLMDTFLVYFAGRPGPHDVEPNSRPLRIEGALGVLFGILALVALLVPFVSAVRVMGVWFIVSGLLTVYSSKSDRFLLSRPAAYIASGIVSMAAGILLVGWQVTPAQLHWIVGLYLVAFGVLNIFCSGGLRTETRRALGLET